MKNKLEHSASAVINVCDLTKAGSAIIIEAKLNNKKLGELTIGRGSVTWKPAKKSVTETTYTWSEFAKIMHPGA